MKNGVLLFKMNGDRLNFNNSDVKFVRIGKIIKQAWKDFFS